MTASTIQSLRDLLARATPGPWVAKPLADRPSRCDGISASHTHSVDVDCYDVDDCPAQREIVTTDSGHYGPSWNDAALIVAAVNALPALLDALEAAEELRQAASNPALRNIGTFDSKEANQRMWDRIYAYDNCRARLPSATKPEKVGGGE